MDEREVNLRDLLFEILLHWRSIIVWMLIGGVLSGSCSYIHLQYSDAAQAEKLSLADLESKLSQSELAAVEQVLLNEYSCGRWQSYMENSARMRLNASRVYQADLIFAVTTGKALANPASVYLDILSSNDIYQFISKKIKGITISDAQELISVIQPGTLIQKQESCSFHITAIAGSKKVCRALSEAAQAYIASIRGPIADTYGDHDVTILKDTIAASRSTSVMQEQIDMKYKIGSLRSETGVMIDEFSEMQLQYYRLRTADDNEKTKSSAKENPGETKASHIYLQSAVWGCIFAVIIYVFVLFFLYIIDNRLRYTDDCAVLYQIPTLGRIPAVQKPKFFFNGVDRQLYKHRDKERHIISDKKAACLAAAAVQIASQKKELHQIYGVSCGLLPEAAANAAREIQHILDADQVELLRADNILYDSDAVHLLNGNAHGAVLIEKAGSVQYKEIRRALDLLRRLEIDVLGMIIIE